jgi:hypothetical protein
MTRWYRENLKEWLKSGLYFRATAMKYLAQVNAQPCFLHHVDMVSERTNGLI